MSSTDKAKLDANTADISMIKLNTGNEICIGFDTDNNILAGAAPANLNAGAAA